MVWRLAHPGEPIPRLLDHINLDKTDNRLGNLRAANCSLNSRNNSSLGGVSPNKGAWQVQVAYEGDTIYCGRWPDLDGAVAAAARNRELLIDHSEAMVRGEHRPFPLLEKKLSKRSDSIVAMRELASRGLTTAEIAKELGCTYANVRICAKKHGIEIKAGRAGRKRTLPDGPDVSADRARQNEYSKASYHRRRSAETPAEAWIRKERAKVIRADLERQKESQKDKPKGELTLDTGFDFFS